VKRAILAGLPNGACVLVGDRWGVVAGGHRSNYGLRVVDFWDGGREYVLAALTVRVAA
jgi:hypothetical protein